MSCVFVFLMTIDIVVIVQLVPWGCLYSSFHSQEGGGEVTRKVIESDTTCSQS
jgi:hypothetical protein